MKILSGKLSKQYFRISLGWDKNKWENNKRHIVLKQEEKGVI